MAQITAVHESLDRRTARAVRTITRLLDKSGVRMDVSGLLRATILDEIHAVNEMSHRLLDTVAGDDIIVNEVYLDFVERVSNGG